MDLQALKEHSIQIYDGMQVCWPQYGYKVETLRVVSELTAKHPHQCASNNSVICFVDDSEVFVTPYTRETIDALAHAGFQMSGFYVPFSNWDYPVVEKSTWESLRRRARSSDYASV